jgi:hypothetical protein
MLGKLLLQAMWLAEKDGPDTDLSAPPFWAYSLLTAMIVAAEADASSQPALLAAFPPLPVAVESERGFNPRAPDMTQFRVAAFAAAAHVLRSPEWEAAAAGDREAPPKSTIDVVVRTRDAPAARPGVGDYGCARRTLVAATSAQHAARFGVRVSREDVQAFAATPLACVNLASHVIMVPTAGADAVGAGGLSRSLPFDVTRVPDARSFVGRQMLDRLTRDFEWSADRARTGASPQLSYLNDAVVTALRAALLGGGGAAAPAGEVRPEVPGLGFDEDTSKSLAHARARLLELRAALVEVQTRDAGAIADAVFTLEAAANEVTLAPLPEDGDDDLYEEARSRLLFLLSRWSGARASLRYEHLVASLLSTGSEAELQLLNPFLSLPDVAALHDAVSAALLATSRFGQASRCIASVDALTSGIQDLVAARLAAAWVADGTPGAQPTPRMVRLALVRTGFHAADAFRELRRLCVVASRAGAAAAAGIHGGTANPAHVALLALHMVDFDEAAAAAALVDPTPVIAILDAAARGCFHTGTQLPDLRRGASATAAHGAAGAPTSASLIHVLQHTADAVAGALIARRAYMTRVQSAGAAAGSSGDGVFEFDPRFLVFEYLLGFVLRARQVELVNQFAAAIRSGRSTVRQMIMGAGKTTVIAPLLVLMLADGVSLVTQVVPSALLEQTLGIMRAAFSSIIVKRVYCLQVRSRPRLFACVQQQLCARSVTI